MQITRGQTILLSCLIGSAVLTAAITYVLVAASRAGTVIREQGPESHRKKSATPSTGGRAFLVTLALVGFPGSILMTDPGAVIGVATGLLTGLIGLADDWMKSTLRNSAGLKARYKLPLQILVGLIASAAVYRLMGDSTVRIPFVHATVDIGAWKIALGVFCYLAIVNGVNFTDGLDGLASSTVLVAAVCLGGAIWSAGAGTSLVPVVLVGMCAGFLPFNWHPARIFMGDSGAFALGGALAAAAIATCLEVTMIIIGIVFIIEITTVVLQVIYFRLTGGKRIFRMTPIHHAWELRGYTEPRIVIGAVAIGLIGGIIGWWAA